MAASKASSCPQYDIRVEGFGPDSDKIVFKYRCIWGKYIDTKEKDYSWGIYEISKDKISDFKELNNATPHQLKYQPAFSRDGRMITFVSGQDNHRNIFVMNADGSNVRQLTHDYNENPKTISEKYITMAFNEMPSFSPEGKRIMFVRSAMKRTFTINAVEKPATIKPSQWDIYEVNLENGKEQRLTNYEFSTISKPQYMSDGKRFVFSANVLEPDNTAATVNREVRNNTWISSYWNNYHYNLIFIMDGTKNDLTPMFTNGWDSSHPELAWNDAILFKSRVNIWDSTLWEGQTTTLTYYYSLFLYKDGQIHRITNKPDTLGYSYVFYSDGLCFFSRGDNTIYSIDGNKKNKIKIPLHKLEKLREYK